MLEPGEKAFGKIAVQSGLLSQADLYRALARQADLAQQGVEQSLRKILIDEKFLDLAKVEEILTIQGFKEARERDKDLARAAVRSGWVTEGQVNRCLDQQKLAWKGKHEIQRLADMLLRKGFLTLVQMESLSGSIPGFARAGPPTELAIDLPPSPQAAPTVRSEPDDPAEERSPGSPAPAAGAGGDAGAPQAASPPGKPAGTRVCPVCQAGMAPDTVRCTACSRRSCPCCDVILPDTSNVCTNCGAWLKE